jgi:hypothetical protein
MVAITYDYSVEIRLRHHVAIVQVPVVDAEAIAHPLDDLSGNIADCANLEAGEFYEIRYVRNLSDLTTSDHTNS